VPLINQTKSVMIIFYFTFFLLALLRRSDSLNPKKYSAASFLTELDISRWNRLELSVPILVKSLEKNVAKFFIPIAIATSVVSCPLRENTVFADDVSFATESPRRIVQTKSGLQYYDIREGEGATPRYGQFVSFQYTLYYRNSPNDPLVEVDSTYSNKGQEPFLHKHGNGRIAR